MQGKKAKTREGSNSEIGPKGASMSVKATILEAITSWNVLFTYLFLF